MTVAKAVSSAAFVFPGSTAVERVCHQRVPPHISGPNRGRGGEVDTIKDIAQIIFYVSLSISGPLAVIEYLKSKKSDRLAQEHKIYDELDTRFFEYQKLALQYYDLDILELPHTSPTQALEKKRKQELIAYAILFSLFERAFLMFYQQTELFRNKQWSGWKYFLKDMIRRDGVRAAWQEIKETYDTDFQQFMDRKIAELLAKPSPQAYPVPSDDLAPGVAGGKAGSS
jgi:hypothetical protein